MPSIERNVVRPEMEVSAEDGEAQESIDVSPTTPLRITLQKELFLGSS
jgi:hypothetical protein